MRLLLTGQVLFFLSYGLASGLAFSAVLNARVKEAEARATAVMITHVPLRQLGELEL